MKRYFYSHPRLTQCLLVASIFLPLPFVCRGVYTLLLHWTYSELAQAITLFSAMIIELLLCLLLIVSPLRYTDKTVELLLRYRSDRTVFHTAERQTRTEAEHSIQEHTAQKKMLPVTDAEAFPLLVGIWQKKRQNHLRESRWIPPADYLHEYYFLYSLPHLGNAEWNAIREDLSPRMLAFFRADQEQKKTIDPVFSVCILADTVAPEIAGLVRAPQTFFPAKYVPIHGVRICAAAVPENRWYLPGVHASAGSRSEYSRRLLGKITFGLKHEIFPYRGNTEYTEQYQQLLEEACSGTLIENAKKLREDERSVMEHAARRKPKRLRKGEFRYDGTEIRFLDRNREIVMYVYLPERAEAYVNAALHPKPEKEELMGNISDLIQGYEEGLFREDPDHIPENYRGKIVIELCGLITVPRLKTTHFWETKRLYKKAQGYLLSMGFEKVSVLKKDRTGILELPISAPKNK